MSITNNVKTDIASNQASAELSLPGNAQINQANSEQLPFQNTQPNKRSAKESNYEVIQDNQPSSSQSSSEERTPTDQLSPKQIHSKFTKALDQQQQNLIALQLYEELQNDLHKALDETKQQQFLLYHQVLPFSYLTQEEIVSLYPERLNQQQRPTMKSKKQKVPQQRFGKINTISNNCNNNGHGIMRWLVSFSHLFLFGF